MSWSEKDIPDQGGRMALITGTGGLGYETALALARKGASVILAGRNSEKGAEAVKKIHAMVPNAKIEFAQLDLADLASIRKFAEGFLTKLGNRKLDLLINNAGVMTPPDRKITKDGFELQFGTNYLGHFALTEALRPALEGNTRARVVNLSSLAHQPGKINFSDLNSQRSYHAFLAYAQSKLAMLMFSRELQRRSLDYGWGFASIAAHPGYAHTELMANGPGSNSLMGKLSEFAKPWVGQSASAGALPILYAATAPAAMPGGYYGPDGFFEIQGNPAPAKVARQALDQTVAERLWRESEKMIQG